MKKPKLVLLVLSAGGLIAVSPRSQALTATYDANTGTTGAQDGAGAGWNPTNVNFWNGTANVVWPNTNVDIAVFGAGSGAANSVTVGTVTTNGINFNATGSANYTLTAGTITLAGITPTITTAAGKSPTIASVLTGTNGLTTDGTGTLILTGANTYSGATIVNAGTLQVGAGGATGTLGTTSATTINGGGTLRFSRNNGMAITNAITGSGALIFQGTGTSLQSDYTPSGIGAGFTGTILVPNSRLRADTTASNFGGTSQITVQSGGGLGLGFTSGPTISTPLTIAGAGWLETGGPYGAVRMENGSTVSGPITLSAAASIFAGVTTVGGGTISGTVNTAGFPLTIESRNATMNFTNAITGAGSLTKSGAGTATLSGTNAYSGTTNVNAGTLTLNYTTNNTSKLSDTETLTLAGGVTVNLTGGSHSEAVGATSITPGNGPVTISRTSGTSVLRLGTILVGAGGSVNFGNNNIATANNLNNGSGILGAWATVNGTDWAVNSTNSPNGPIIAYTGYSDVPFAGTIVGNPTAHVRLTGGIFGEVLLGSEVTTISSLLQSQLTATTINTSGKTLRLGLAGGIFSGIGMGALNIGNTANSGTLSAGGTQADEPAEIAITNSSANPITINAAIANNGQGDVSLTKAGVGNVLLTGTNSFTGNIAIGQGVLEIGGAGSLTNFNGLIANHGSFVYSSTANSTLGGIIFGSGSILKSSASTLTLLGSNFYTGTTTISAGTLELGGTDGTVGTGAVVNNGTLLISRNTSFTLANNMGGTGALVQTGAGTTTLGGTNTYSGGTTISAGDFNFTAATAVPATGSVSIATGSSATITSTGTNTIAAPFSGAGTLFLNLSTGAANNTYLTGASTGFTGKVILNGSGGNKLNASGLNLSPSAEIVINQGAQLFSVAPVPNPIVAIGTGNTENRGALRIATGANLSGQLTLQGNTTIGTEGGTISGPITVGGGTPTTLTLGTTSSTAGGTYSGTISDGNGTLSITTINGTNTLAGTNTYSGATLVNGGTLNVTGSLANSAITMATATTLGGEGSASSLTTSGTSNLVINPATTGAFTTSGALTLGGVVTVSFSNAGAVPTGPIRVVNFGSTSATPANFALASSGNYRTPMFTVGATGVDLELGNTSLVWTGTGGLNWDINGTSNWTDPSPAASKFFSGDSVLFDDTPAANQSIAMAVAVQPASVVVNSSYDYTFTGVGSITGGTGLTKAGTGTLTMSQDHTFGGNVSVGAGVLKFGAAKTILGAVNNGSNVVVASGAAIDWNGFGNTSAVYGKNFTIGGSGPAGSGVFTNSGVNGYTTNVAALGNITLSGNATIGGSGNLQLIGPGYIPATVNLGGFTLTKTGTGGMLFNRTAFTGGGAIDIQQGELAFWGNTGPSTIGASTPINIGNGSNVAAIKIVGGQISGSITAPITLNQGIVTSWGGQGTIHLDSSISMTEGTTNAFVAGSGDALFIPNAITGNANFTQATTGGYVNAGWIYLTGTTSNTYTGTTVVDSTGGGGVQLNKTGGAVALNSAGGVLQFGGTPGSSQPRIYCVPGSGNEQIGAGTVINFANPTGSWTRYELVGTSQTLAGVNTGNLTTQGSGVIQNGALGDNAVRPTSILTLNGSGSYLFNGHFRNMDTGASTSLLGLIKNGSGTQTLVGNVVTYSGQTTVNSGTLVLSKTGALATPINNGATVEINAVSGDDWVLGAGKTLSGGGVWNKTGDGRASLNNTTLLTTGKFNIQAGSLRNNSNASVWTNSTADIDISTDAILDLYADAIFVDQLTGTGFVQNGYGNATGQSGATANIERLVVGVADGSSTFEGVIRNNATNTLPAATTAGGGVQLEKVGTGTLTLTGANLYSGLTLIKNGAIAVTTADDRLPTASQVILGDSLTTGKLIIGDEVAARNQTIGGLASTGLGGSVVGANGLDDSILTINVASGAPLFNGTLGGAGTNENKLALVKSGTGTFILQGSHTFTGTTVVTNGTFDLAGSINSSDLTLGDASALSGEGSAANLTTLASTSLNIDPTTAGAFTVLGTLTMMDLTAVNVGSGTPDFGPIRVINYGSTDATLSNFTLFNGGNYRNPVFTVGATHTELTLGNTSLIWTASGGSTWDINTTSNWNDPSPAPSKFFAGDAVTFEDGPGANQTVTLASALLPSKVTFDNMSVSYTLSGAGSIGGSGGLLKKGANTATISLANSFTGGTTISNGTIRTTNNAALSNGTITLGDANTGASNVSWLFNGSGTPANNIVVSNQGSGTVILGTHSAGTFTIASGTLTLNRPITFQDSTNDRTTFSGKISGNVGTITIAGTRITFANATNNFVGNLAINSGSIYQSDSPTTLPATTSVTVNGTGSYRINGGATHAIDALNGTGNVNIIAGGAATLSLGNSAGSGTFSGVISNGAATLTLVKTGAGTQTLTGPNTYTGTTTVNGGSLILGASGTLAAGSAVTVATTASLAGTGTANGTVAIQAGAFIAPGVGGIGTLSTGSLAIGGTYECQVDSVSADKLAVTGNLNLTGATFAFSAIAPPTAPIYLIATYSGVLSGGRPVVTGLPAGYLLDMSVPGQLNLVSGYSGWAQLKGLTLLNNGYQDDPDGDNITNLMEFYLDGDPLTSDLSVLPSLLVDGNYLHLSFKRRDDAEPAFISQLAEYGSDLNFWSNSTIPMVSAPADANGVIIDITENGAAPDGIDIKIPLSLEDDGKLFGRIKLSQ